VAAPFVSHLRTDFLIATKGVVTECHPYNAGGVLLRYSEDGGVITFQVRVVPRASRTEIAGEHDGALRVRVTAPPVDGAANEEVIRLLARALGVPRSHVEIVSGQTSKLKRVKVHGARPANLAALTK